MADQIDLSQTPTETPTALYDTLFPVERYHRALEAARGRVRGVRAGEDTEKRIEQMDAQYLLTSGCKDWVNLCDACGIMDTDKVLAAHRAEFGTVTFVDLLRFVMEVKWKGWTLEQVEKEINRVEDGS